jgi:hypothetical protein
MSRNTIIALLYHRHKLLEFVLLSCDVWEELTATLFHISTKLHD